MKFSTVNPDSERGILILCDDGEGTYMIQGQFYIDEDDYYTHDGELLDNVIAWSRLPDVEWI